MYHSEKVLYFHNLPGKSNARDISFYPYHWNSNSVISLESSCFLYPNVPFLKKVVPCYVFGKSRNVNGIQDMLLPHLAIPVSEVAVTAFLKMAE